MEDIEHYEIPIYNFPYDVEEDDEDTIEDNSELRALLPFAIVGSEAEADLSGQLVRARVYPWGTAEVDNPKHSDFGKLRRVLLKYVTSLAGPVLIDGEHRKLPQDRKFTCTQLCSVLGDFWRCLPACSAGNSSSYLNNCVHVNIDS